MRSNRDGDSLTDFWSFENQGTTHDGKDRAQGGAYADGWMWSSYLMSWTLQRLATWATTGDGKGYGAGSPEGDGPGVV